MPSIDLLTGRIKKTVYRPHAHEEYAIGVVEAGVQTYREPGGSYHAPPGTIYTLNPGDVHAGESADESGYQYRLIYVPETYVLKCLEQEIGILTGHPHFKQRLTNDIQLSKKLQAFLSSLNAPGICRVKAETELVILLKELFSRYGEIVEESIANPGESSILRVTEMIRKRFAEPVTLSDMAELAGLSRYHFIRVFQTKTGLSPHAYLTQIRVFHAKKAIESGVSLTDAAMVSGFSDQSHMSRYFKTIYGISPGKFRQK